MTEEPVGLIGASYRSGTQWLYFNFKDAYRDHCRVMHEAELELMVFWPGIHIGFRVAAHAKKLKYIWPEVPLIHITRHPVDMAISAMRKGYKRWDIAIQQWYEIHMNLVEAEPAKRYQIENIWADPQPNLAEMAEIFSLPRRDFAWADRRVDQSSHYIAEHQVPDRAEIVLPAEVRDLATEFGYKC